MEIISLILSDLFLSFSLDDLIKFLKGFFVLICKGSKGNSYQSINSLLIRIKRRPYNYYLTVFLQMNLIFICMMAWVDITMGNKIQYFFILEICLASFFIKSIISCCQKRSSNSSSIRFDCFHQINDQVWNFFGLYFKKKNCCYYSEVFLVSLWGLVSRSDWSI